MKKIILSALLLFVVALFSTCEYGFSEDYYKEIVVTEPIVSLSLTNFKENDTLIKPRRIEYKYNAPDKNLLYQINFYVDNKVIYQSSKKESYFPLEIKSLSNGNHILKIEYIFRLGSESLVDLLGNELVKKEETISFVVNNNVPLEIEKLELRDGTIYIHFKPYPLADKLFESITPTYIVESEYGSIEYNIFENSYNYGVIRDRRSIASKLTYSTKVKTSYSETVSEKKTIEIPDTFKFDIEVKNPSEIKIKWTEHPLYNNIDLNIKYNYDNTDIDTSIGNNGISLYAKGGEKTIPYLGFGTIVKYKVYNELFFNSNNNTILEGTTALGSRFETPKNGFKKIIHSKANNRFYALSIEQIDENSLESDVYIYELESDDLKTIKRTKITTSKNIYGDLIKDSFGNLIIDLYYKSIILDINSLSVISEYNLSELTTDNNGTLYLRENTIFITNYSFNRKIEIFDKVTKNKIQTLFGKGSLKITDDGKHFSLEKKIYKIEGSTITEVIESPMQGSSVLIKGLDMDVKNNKLYFLSGYEGFKDNELYEYDLNTKIAKKTPLLPSYISSFYYSNKEQKLLCKYSDYSKKELYILDLNNNQVKSINANLTFSFLYFDGKLISANGAYLNNFF